MCSVVLSCVLVLLVFLKVRDPPEARPRRMSLSYQGGPLEEGSGTSDPSHSLAFPDHKVRSFDQHVLI